MDEQKVKNIFYKILSVFFVVLTLIIVYSVLWGPASKFADSLAPTRLITVSAEDKATVTPDIAKISFSVVSEGADPGAVAEQNNKKMNDAINFVKEQGIDDKDIQTTEYNLSPRYNYSKETGRSSIYGYELRQSVALKIRDFGKISDILAGLPAYGINQIGTVSFGVDDPEKYLGEARGRAFDKARVKAEAMVKANGARLGRVINISELTGGGPVPYGYGALERGGAPALTAPTIEPGSEVISVNVSVTYEIK